MGPFVGSPLMSPIPHTPLTATRMHVRAAPVAMQVPVIQTKESPPGSWSCPACGNVNYASREVCNTRKCRAPRPDVISDAAPTRGIEQGQGSWSCPQCGNLNYGFRDVCNT